MTTSDVLELGGFLLAAYAAGFGAGYLTGLYLRFFELV